MDVPSEYVVTSIQNTRYRSSVQDVVGKCFSPICAELRVWHKSVYILSQQDQLIALADYEFTRRDANRHSGIDTSKLLKIRMRLTAGADTFQVSETFGGFFSRSVFAPLSNILFYTDNNSERHWIS